MKPSPVLVAAHAACSIATIPIAAVQIAAHAARTLTRRLRHG